MCIINLQLSPTHPHTHTHVHACRFIMAKNCCRYFTVSLVPVAALILAVVFAGGVLILPILYSELVKNYVVSEGVWFRGHVTSLRKGG